MNDATKPKTVVLEYRVPACLAGGLAERLGQIRQRAEDAEMERTRAWATLRLRVLADLTDELGEALGGALCAERLPLSVPDDFDEDDCEWRFQVLTTTGAKDGGPAVWATWCRFEHEWLRQETSIPRAIALVLPGSPPVGPYRWQALSAGGTLRVCRDVWAALAWSTGDPAVAAAGLASNKPPF